MHDVYIIKNDRQNFMIIRIIIKYVKNNLLCINV